MTAPDPESELLVAYVREALLRQSRNEPIDATAICRAHPHLAPALAEALGLAGELAGLQRAAAAVDALQGHLLADRYRLEAGLGRGAMGVVYRAVDTTLRRTVAVKILDVRLFADEVAEQRFQREAELLAALRHPHVVTVHDRGRTADGIHFLVMDLLEGATLASILGRATKGEEPAAVLASLGIAATEHWPRQCARWGQELAQGLAAAHALGIVHRDVKPSNVFVTRGGAALLLDFGIATQAGSSRLTMAESTLGTPWYMAPEQVRRGGAATLPTQDVYGLSATLYHLLAGRPPYEGDGPAVLASLATTDPLPLRRLRPDTPRDLAAIVEHGMERAVARRYPTAAELAADLQRFLNHELVHARPISAAGRVLRAAGRRPARATALTATVLLLVASALLLPLWSADAQRRRQRERDDLYARLPSLIALEGTPQERLLEVLQPEHRDGERLLSAILELDPDDLAVRLFRGALRLDLGEHEAAADDFRRIAAAVGSPHVAALAQRYLQADRGRNGTEAVDATGLPAPQSSADRLVAGFHELRNRQRDGFADRAVELLQAAAPEQPAAHDLLLIALVAKADRTLDEDARAQLFQSACDACVRLEGVLGRPTARTLAMRGVALIGLKRYREAEAPLRASLELRGGRHGPLQNLGVALWRLGRLDEAEAALKQALAVRPFAWNTSYTLAQVARDRGDFAAAHAYASKVPCEPREGLDWKQPDLVGNIAIREAFVLLDNDRAAAAEAAGRAAAAFAQALAGPTATRSASLANRLRVESQLAEAMRAGDLATALNCYLNVARLSADDPYTLSNVARLLPPEGIGPESTFLLGLWIREVARLRAGGDTALRDRLRRELEQLQKPPR